MSKAKDLEAVPTECAIKIILKVVRPHSTMTYEPDVDVDAPIGMLKEDVEDVINVLKIRQQWSYKDAILDDDQTLSQVVTHGETEIIVNILPE